MTRVRFAVFREEPWVGILVHSSECLIADAENQQARVLAWAANETDASGVRHTVNRTDFTCIGDMQPHREKTGATGTAD